MPNDARTAERGFSLLEAIVVVAISLVMAALTAQSVFNAVDSFQLDSTSRQIGALAQLAHMKAPAQNTRYKVKIDASAGTYSMQVWDRTANQWQADQGSATLSLPKNVTFSTTGVSTPPTGMGTTVTQASSMTFNNIGLLVDGGSGTATDAGSGAALDNQCVYIQKNTRTNAVCSTAVGRTVTFRFSAGAWQPL